VVTAARHARTGAPTGAPPARSPWREAIDRAHEARFAKLNAGQLASAERLLDAMLAAAEDHGVSLSHFDEVADLPGACLDVVAARDRRRTGRLRSFDKLHR